MLNTAYSNYLSLESNYQMLTRLTILLGAFAVVSYPFSIFRKFSDQVIFFSVIWLELSFLLTSLTFFQFPLLSSLFSYLLSAFASTAAIWDIACCSLISLIFILYFVRIRKISGPVQTVIKSLQLVSLVVLPLGIEIYLFSNMQFNIPIARILFYTPLSWITNSLLLYGCAVIFILTTLMRLLYGSRLWGRHSIPEREE